MSDGPYRSLPMARAWKRVAERADNLAFSREEINGVLVPALERDCREHLSPNLLKGIRAALDDRNTYLFRSEIGPLIEGFRSEKCSIMDRALLDNVCALSAQDAAGADVLVRALEAVVVDRAARGARQIEEHYVRRTDASRANGVRDRLESAIATIDSSEIAAHLLDQPRGSRGGPQKRRGLDDGVELP